LRNHLEVLTHIKIEPTLLRALSNEIKKEYSLFLICLYILNAILTYSWLNSLIVLDILAILTSNLWSVYLNHLNYEFHPTYYCSMLLISNQFTNHLIQLYLFLLRYWLIRIQSLHSYQQQVNMNDMIKYHHFQYLLSPFPYFHALNFNYKLFPIVQPNYHSM
jgi:hypothetical protein